MLATGRAAREGARALRLSTPQQRTTAILAAAEAIRASAATILAANAADFAAARAAGLPAPMLDRMMLDADRLAAVADAVDPGRRHPRSRGRRDRPLDPAPNGLDIARVRTPIGVIAIIYESRPNVTADAAALCIRSGNAAILRGGSECLRTNLALHAAMVKGLT
jgi:glutamate-5-semialdehyde dehydrogenase